MTLFKSALLASMSAAVFALGAPAADAQSACGAQYRVESGDTLYRISQACRISANRIMELNPQIGDPNRLDVGMVLRMETGAQADTAGPDGQEDPLAAIAQMFGASLLGLGDESGEAPSWADWTGDEPDTAPAERQVSVEPSSGEVGSQVDIHARNLRPHDWVTVGAGQTSSQWREIRQVQVDSQGDVRTRAEVPRWADAGDRLVFVVDTDRGLTLKSDDFVVTGDRDRRPDDRHRIGLEGRLERGVECMTLTTPEGEVYSLVSDHIRLSAGEYVQVEGRRAEMSFCQQGRATVEVERLREVRPW